MSSPLHLKHYALDLAGNLLTPGIVNWLYEYKQFVAIGETPWSLAFRQHLESGGIEALFPISDKAYRELKLTNWLKLRDPDALATGLSLWFQLWTRVVPDLNPEEPLELVCRFPWSLPEENLSTLAAVIRRQFPRAGILLLSDLRMLVYHLVWWRSELSQNRRWPFISLHLFQCWDYLLLCAVETQQTHLHGMSQQVRGWLPVPTAKQSVQALATNLTVFRDRFLADWNSQNAYLHLSPEKPLHQAMTTASRLIVALISEQNTDIPIVPMQDVKTQLQQFWARDCPAAPDFPALVVTLRLGDSLPVAISGIGDTPNCFCRRLVSETLFAGDLSWELGLSLSELSDEASVVLRRGIITLPHPAKSIVATGNRSIGSVVRISIRTDSTTASIELAQIKLPVMILREESPHDPLSS